MVQCHARQKTHVLVIKTYLKVAGTDRDSNDIMMIVANGGARMSMLAFTSEVGSGSSTLDFVETSLLITPSVVILENSIMGRNLLKLTFIYKHHPDTI